MENTKLSEGQVLFDYSLKEYKIDKVAKKYFYCNGSDTPYGISNLKYECKNYSQFNRQLFLTKQEVEDDKEISELYSKICSYFRNSFRSDLKLSLENLRQINKIIKNE